MGGSIDKEHLKYLLDQGVRPAAIARQMGVSKAAVSQMIRKLKLAIASTLAIDKAPVIVEKKLNAVEQLQKINANANELLDLVMRWNRGDEQALRILESQVRMIKVGQGEDVEWVKEFKIKDPREIALKAMAEIRQQLKLQLDVFKTLYDVEGQQEFQTEVLDVIGEVDPNVRREILRRLAHRRLVRKSFDPRQ